MLIVMNGRKKLNNLNIKLNNMKLNNISEEEKETIDGFDIEKRELTEEEKTREITIDVIDEFHANVGEDLMDQLGHLVNYKVLAGFLMCKHNNLAKQFIDVINDKYGEPLKLKAVYEDNELTEEDFYKDFCEFINLTVNGKAAFNQVLIQCNEYYND